MHVCRYSHVRSTDRMLNNYPLLHYPEMYLLEGGYRAFYNKYKVRAISGVRMHG